MITKKYLIVVCLGLFGFVPGLLGQHVEDFNLPISLRENKLEMTSGEDQIEKVDSLTRHSITIKGIVWLKDEIFDTGTIDIDLRGRNVFLQSFMGIAFHAKDTNSYDVVYFCPFRFHDSSEETRRYSVKYMSVPDYSYTKLRKEHPRVYENEVQPAPASDAWFHVKITVESQWVSVFINHSSVASLRVRKLPTLQIGKIGLWSYSQTLSSDFANLKITR